MSKNNFHKKLSVFGLEILFQNHLKTITLFTKGFQL